MKKLILITALAMSSFAFADTTSIDDTNEAVTETLKEFKTSQTHDVVDSFTGIKAWPVSGGIKAKVYLKDNKSISYSCHRHNANDPFECHEL